MALRAMLKDVERPIIFDVGAHFGNVTQMFLRSWPSAQVHCFEPEPMGLQRLHDRFGRDDRVIIVPLALGSSEGTADFYVCGQTTEMSSLLPRAEFQGRRYYRHQVRDTIKVEVGTLDGYREARGIGQVHLLKMDVQGGERGVLLGASRTLTMQRIWAIYSEVLFVTLYQGNALFWELCSLLSRRGYTLFDIYSLQRSWINRQLKYGDALWVGSKLRKVLNDYPEDWLKKSLESRMCPER